jgi:hypothetical protein
MGSHLSWSTSYTNVDWVESNLELDLLKIGALKCEELGPELDPRFN